MKNLFKSSCLVVALLATVAMVGCGGGGGSSSAPVNTQSSEAETAKSSVTSSVVPVVNNFSTILNGGVTASFRTSTSNTQEYSVNSTGDAIISALETPKLLRAILRASGGTIEDGLWMGGKDTYSYIEVASYSNGVYERTLYYDYGPYYYVKPTNGNEFPLATAGHYLINGCNCVLDGTTLKSLSINPNAQITIEEFTREGKIKNLIKGTIDTDLTIAYDGGKEENIPDSDSFIDYDGKKITISENGYYWGFKATKKITSRTTYSLSKPIVLKVNNASGTSDKYNEIWNWNNGYSDSTTELTKNEYSSNNINITISGITGTISTAKTAYLGNHASYSNGKWYNYNDPIRYSYYFTVSEKPIDNLKYASTCEVTISGDLSYNQNYGKVDGYAYGMPIETTPTANKSGTINSVNVKLRNVSGNLDSIVVGDAEAHVDIGDYNQDKVIMIGDTEVAFNKAKIDVTGLKYDYRWEPTAEKRVLIQDSWWWYTEPNEEYTRQLAEMNRKCFGNSIVKISATESKNNVTITANCDINKQTATAHLVNNGNTYKLKDDVTEFDFRTLDINATKVDVLADKNCEGAELAVTCVEKNNTTTKRKYKVVNGKLVRSDSKEVIVKVPTEIQELDSNEIAKEISELPKEELIPIETKDGSEFKVAKKDGKSFATYNKGKETDKVKVQTNIIGMTNSLFAISFFTDNDKTYTILFVIENKDGKKLINGSIFNEKQPGLDSKDRYNGDFAWFNSDDGKKITVSPIKGTVFDIPIQ